MLTIGGFAYHMHASAVVARQAARQLGDVGLLLREQKMIETAASQLSRALLRHSVIFLPQEASCYNSSKRRHQIFDLLGFSFLRYPRSLDRWALLGYFGITQVFLVYQWQSSRHLPYSREVSS